MTENRLTQVQFSREEFWGTWKDWVVLLPTIFGPPFFAIWALDKYRLFDEDDSLFFKVSLGVGLVVILTLRAWVWKNWWAKHVPAVACMVLLCLGFLGGLRQWERSSLSMALSTLARQPRSDTP